MFVEVQTTKTHCGVQQGHEGRPAGDVQPKTKLMTQSRTA